jgi:hypothetical protein
MDVVVGPRPGAPSPAAPRPAEWWLLTLTGAGAFWSANLVISLTPVAADYRAALSIRYVAMLVEAAVGGLLLAGVIALALTRWSVLVPRRGTVAPATLLSLAALVAVTALVEVPAKLGSGVDDAAHWLLVATVFNAIRILALGLSMGLVARLHDHRRPAATAPKEGP